MKMKQNMHNYVCRLKKDDGNQQSVGEKDKEKEANTHSETSYSMKHLAFVSSSCCIVRREAKC